MKYATIVAAATLALAGCHKSPAPSSKGIDTSAWTCDSIISSVIDMSQEETLKIMEIDEPFTFNADAKLLSCQGNAETSHGKMFIKYGGHVTDQGKVMLEYQPS